MCLDVVFGLCCLPGMAVDAHITHEVNFLFLCKSKRMVVSGLTSLLFIFMHSGYNSLCEPILSVRLSVSCLVAGI